MDAKKIEQILIEGSYSPSMARSASNLIYNHLVVENSYLENPEEYRYQALLASHKILDEVRRAKHTFSKNFKNQHEGYAVILEELDELWDEIKKNQINYDIEAQRKEAIQAAAMLVRFIVELTNQKNPCQQSK